MSPVKYFRIDERLIHGQILQKWLDYTGVKNVFVIDDDVAEDPIMQSVLSMTIPKGIEVEFLSEAEGGNRIAEYNSPVMILLRTLDALWNLYEKNTLIESVNICRLPYSSGKRQIYNNIFVSENEYEIIKKMMNKGVDIFVQMVPDNEAIYFRKFLR